ncbi:MAG: B12-binding domain-containing radical SAM protein [Nitrospirae bacterium]|nr:B12-binding domain-containing radical SAM protein [Magnetococcales bacterium]HAT51204.1 hypothetical protein [Alphaproteobacteria bacterium]
MRFLFVYPNEQLNHTPQMGILILGSLLETHGVDVSVCDLTFVAPDQWYPYVDKTMARFKPDVVGVSVRTMKFTLACHLLREIRKHHPEVTLVAGGPQATYSPEDVAPEVDFGIMGDGEGVCLDLCRLIAEGRRREISELPNIFFHRDGALIKNKPRPLYNLADIPLMNYALFDERHYRDHNFLHVVPGSKICGVFEGSRGCPYQCTYCSSPTLMALNKDGGKWRREKPASQIRREIDHFRSYFGHVDMLYFVDEVMMTSDARTKELRENLEDLAVPFIFSERPELITADRARDMKAAGAYSCCIGIESGNEPYRQKLLQRKMTDEKLKNGFRLMRESGVKTHALNMMGLPDQNGAIMKETFELLQVIQPDTAQATIFFPLPATVLETKVRADNLYRGHRYPDNYYQESLLDFPEGHKKAVSVYAHMVNDEFFRDTPLRRLAAWFMSRFPHPVFYRRVRNLVLDLETSHRLGVAGSVRKIWEKLARPFYASSQLEPPLDR